MSFTRNNPFSARIAERFSLTTPESNKSTHHLVIDMAGSGIQYRVGDSLGVLPENRPEEVEHVLKCLHLSGEERVHGKRDTQERSLRSFLLLKANLGKVNKNLLRFLLGQKSSDKKKLESLLDPENKKILQAYLGENWLSDVLEDFCSGPVDAQEFCDCLLPLLPRLYSIASSPLAEKEHIHLTIAEVNFQHRARERRGVCTHFLCERALPGETKIPIYIQTSDGFILPQDPSTPIIMVGPGTGVAPFRAFLQERLHQGDTGPNWLFFGERHRKHSFLYGDYFLSLEKQKQLRLDLAFSRDQSEKIYVQHRMEEQGKDLWKWLNEGAHLYVCGDAQYMAKDVESALERIAKREGQLDDAGAKSFLQNLRKEKRYLKDVY